MVAVLSSIGTKLMPTSNYRARKLLKKERAKIYKYRPFTIQLLDREEGYTQPIEYKCDTGYQHIGISICSQKHEYVNLQVDMLKDETERHNDQRKYRRTRRNRLRHRAPRFKNRVSSKKKGWLAPSVRHKKEIHIQWFKKYYEVMPITDATFEVGEFDTQLLKALQTGSPIPTGNMYQQGPRYKISTLRNAIFTRDNYTCCICGNGIPQNTILCVHHIGYWCGDRTDRLDNLLTVCTKCHVPANHQPGGILYGLKPKLKNFKGATFMTIIRWQLLDELKTNFPDIDFHATYGSETKERRRILKVKKSHSNDAYVMGDFHPKHRTDFVLLTKKRCNNRILEKFYDAKYIDSRDGSKKSGKDLSSGRTRRGIYSTNLRCYRQQKVSKGRRSIRRNHYLLQPHDVVIWNNQKYTVKGVHNNGTRVILKKNNKSVKISDIKIIRHCNGYY